MIDYVFYLAKSNKDFNAPFFFIFVIRILFLFSIFDVLMSKKKCILKIWCCLSFAVANGLSTCVVLCCSAMWYCIIKLKEINMSKTRNLQVHAWKHHNCILCVFQLSLWLVYFSYNLLELLAWKNIRKFSCPCFKNRAQIFEWINDNYKCWRFVILIKVNCTFNIWCYFHLQSSKILKLFDFCVFLEHNDPLANDCIWFHH